MEETNAYETQENVDYGVILYEKSNAKSVLDAPSGKVGAKGWAQRIYMLILGVAMFGWFLYSFINALNDEELGIPMAILSHILPLLFLSVAEFILMLTAFGGWGKFARLALKHKALTRQHRMEGVKTRELEEELQDADANKAKENAIRIYKDYVVVVNRGTAITIQRDQLQCLKCNPGPKGYQLKFCLYDNKEFVANELVPISDLPLVKKHFDNFEDTPARRQKGYIKKKIPMLAFAFIPLLIGVALLIIHFLVLPDMPVIFGIVFAAFGVIFVTAQFDDVAVIKYGVMSILGGLLLMGLPLGIALTIVDLVESISFATIFSTFTEFHAVMSLFFGLGPMLIILGIAGIVDCTRM